MRPTGGGNDHRALDVDRTVRTFGSAGRLLAQRLATSAEGLIAVLDMDGFGRVNDRHGTELGDALLAEIEQSLQSVMRDGDALALGGDQFVALLPGHHAAADAASTLLRAVRHAGVRTPNGWRVRVTASAGLARWPDHGCTAGDLVAAADLALRHAKAVTEHGGWTECPSQ